MHERPQDAIKEICEVSVVIPCYNESENLPPLAHKIQEVFATLRGYRYECIFVNDGSTDATKERLEVLESENPCLRAIHLKKNSGQSAALLAGMRAARGRYILTLDADLQNDPADFPKILELLEHYDCVCGYRTHRQDNWSRVFISKIANRLLRILLGTGVRDAGCGAKGFRRACLEHFVSFNGMHRYFPVFVRAAGLSIVEIPVIHHHRIHGVSKYGINNRLWRTLYDAIGVAWLRRRYVHAEIEETPKKAMSTDKTRERQLVGKGGGYE